MNTRDLRENMCKHFSCIDGVPRAYMEVPMVLDDGSRHVARFVYEIVGVTMRGSPEIVEEVLCGWMWQKLISAFEQELIEDRNILIMFRRWPEFSVYIDSEGHDAAKLTMRLVIPGDNLKRIFGPAVTKESELLYRL
jgi:hypothetical protein